MSKRTVIIHNLKHAEAALTAAARLRVPVTLMSAPGAAAYLGAAVFRDMVEAAAAAVPGAEFTAVLDCGEDPGLALGALRQGIKRISVSASPDVREKIADIARQTGAVLDDGKEGAIDLLEEGNALEACLAWLEKG